MSEEADELLLWLRECTGFGFDFTKEDQAQREKLLYDI
jgi:hypothetical protein